tara:strand:+ start:196 stop:735 length:540 start_codon:yes stop_codon:yes gene_type:complete
MSENNTSIAVPINTNNVNTQTNEVPVVYSSSNILFFDENIHINDHLKNVIYSRSKFVKVLSLIDIFFLIINLGISIANKNYFWLFFLLFPLCCCGFYGASKYLKNFIISYNCYIFIMCIYYLTITFYFNSFLFLIFFGIELFFFQYVSRLCYYLGNANDQIINELQNGWKPSQFVTYYY